MITWKVKQWVRHTASKHYWVNWDMMYWSVVERYEDYQRNLLHLRQCTLKMEVPVVYRIRVHVHYATWHHMPHHHNAESPPWEPQIYLKKLCYFMQDIWDSLWGMRYNMWGFHSVAHWQEFKSSEIWHCVWSISILLDHGVFIVRVGQSR